MSQERYPTSDCDVDQNRPARGYIWMRWILLVVWYLERHPKAYQPTYVPFFMTATVGLAYLAGVWWKMETVKRSNRLTRRGG